MNEVEGVEKGEKFVLIEGEGIGKEKELHGGEEIRGVCVEIK